MCVVLYELIPTKFLDCTWKKFLRHSNLRWLFLQERVISVFSSVDYVSPFEWQCNELLLEGFYGIWCPYRIIYEAEIFLFFFLFLHPQKYLFCQRTPNLRLYSFPTWVLSFLTIPLEKVKKQQEKVKHTTKTMIFWETGGWNWYYIQIIYFWKKVLKI